ncbi:MAG: phage holin family protein [bacterium]
MLIKLLIRWILYTLALLLIVHIIPGISISGILTALIVTLAISFTNFFIKPFIMLLALPINLMTFGLFGIIINSLLLMLIAFLIPQFIIKGFIPALMGSILFSIFSIIINKITGKIIKF